MPSSCNLHLAAVSLTLGGFSCLDHLHDTSTPLPQPLIPADLYLAPRSETMLGDFLRISQTGTLESFRVTAFKEVKYRLARFGINTKRILLQLVNQRSGMIFSIVRFKSSTIF